MSFLETGRGWRVATFASWIALATFAAVAGAQTQGKALPDAQVESNVLRQLATAPELSTQSIQSSTVYGTVTLTGTVQTEALRAKAEDLASRADGVKKVVDELVLGDPASAQAVADPQGQNSLQQDGSYAYASQAGPQGSYPQQPGGTQGRANPTLSGQGYGSQPYPGQTYGAQQQYPGQQNTSQQFPGQQYPGAGSSPYPDQAYGNQPNGASQAQYGPGAPEYNRGSSPQGRRPLYGNGYAPGGAPYAGEGNQAGQPAGLVATVPGGSIVQVRINRGIDSNHIQPGTPFDGIVLSDVVSGGVVAIPRGAAVQGTVVDSKQAGAFKGQGALALQINNLVLGGQNYPLTSEVWEREGRDKTVRTVNSTVGLGALGAVFGGLAGGGAGAAIGAGVGAGVGLAGAAASPGGRVIVPPESVLSFRLSQPLTLTTVSQQEMARLAYGAGPVPAPAGPPVVRRRYYSPYRGYYYGPVAPGPYGYPPY